MGCDPMSKPHMFDHEVVIRMKFQSSSAHEVGIAQAMRRAIAQYWAISENSKVIEATINGKPVPRLRKPLVKARS